MQKEYGELVIRARPLPSDSNPLGNAFGGWIMAQLDLAGVVLASKTTSNFVVTRSINEIMFEAPVKIGHLVSIYGKVKKIGNTSITVDLILTDSELQAKEQDEIVSVTASATYIAVDKETLKPIAINKP